MLAKSVCFEVCYQLKVLKQLLFTYTLTQVRTYRQIALTFEQMSFVLNEGCQYELLKSMNC